LITATPVFGLPLLLIENKLRVLVASDVHLGLEHELWLCGISIPSQTDRLLERLINCLNEIEPDRLVLLGDTKHNVPRTSWQEKKEVPHFLRSLSRIVQVDIVPGNHDGGLADLAPIGTSVMTSSGYVLDGAGYFHGHTWPDPILFRSEMLVTGHIHPAIRLFDPLGHFQNKPVWAKVSLVPDAIEDQYKQKLPNPEMIIVPAFNDLCGGFPLNEPDQDERGPILTMADMNKAGIFLLDGTNLGSLGAIKSHDNNKSAGKRKSLGNKRTTKEK
jgi:putative SbcD/Mre11-related phosphoesterase